MRFGMKKVLPVLAAVMCMWGVTAYGSENNTYVGGTYINGADVSGKTVEEARGILEDPNSYCLQVIKKDGSSDEIRGSEIGYHAAVTGDLEAILTEQNSEGRIVGPAVEHHFTVEMSAGYDQAALESRITVLPCIIGGNVARTQDARISDYVEGQPFTIIKEVNGEDVDQEKAKAAIMAAVAAGQGSVNLKEQGCYRAAPLIGDRLIFSLLNRRQITDNSFTKELNFLHLTKEASGLIAKELEDRLKKTIMHKELGRQVSYQYLMRLEAYKLVKHLMGEKEYEGFKIWW